MKRPIPFLQPEFTMEANTLAQAQQTKSYLNSEKSPDQSPGPNIFSVPWNSPNEHHTMGALLYLQISFNSPILKGETVLVLLRAALKKHPARWIKAFKSPRRLFCCSGSSLSVFLSSEDGGRILDLGGIR